MVVSTPDCSFLCLDYIKWSMRADSAVMGHRGCYKSKDFLFSRCPYLPDPSLRWQNMTADEIVLERKMK